MIELSPAQQRVVGALAEKELTTPDNYPLSMNALVAACNQTTNRDPVVTFTQETIENALANLKSNGVARVVYSKGMRVDKYRHVLHDALSLEEGELALLTVLLLRGPQTGAELRARTERMHPFTDQEAVDAALARLAGRDPALVALLARQPGQKEPRWVHRLGPASYRDFAAPAASAPAMAQTPTPTPTPTPAPTEPTEPTEPMASPDRVSALEARIAALEERLDVAGL